MKFRDIPGVVSPRATPVWWPRPTDRLPIQHGARGIWPMGGLSSIHFEENKEIDCPPTPEEPAEMTVPNPPRPVFDCKPRHGARSCSHFYLPFPPVAILSMAGSAYTAWCSRGVVVSNWRSCQDRRRRWLVRRWAQRVGSSASWRVAWGVHSLLPAVVVAC
jgi:hypothetical protein